MSTQTETNYKPVNNTLNVKRFMNFYQPRRLFCIKWRPRFDWLNEGVRYYRLTAVGSVER